MKTKLIASSLVCGMTIALITHCRLRLLICAPGCHPVSFRLRTRSAPAQPTPTAQAPAEEPASQEADDGTLTSGATAEAMDR